MPTIAFLFATAKAITSCYWLQSLVLAHTSSGCNGKKKPKQIPLMVSLPGLCNFPLCISLHLNYSTQRAQQDVKSQYSI